MKYHFSKTAADRYGEGTLTGRCCCWNLQIYDIATNVNKSLSIPLNSAKGLLSVSKFATERIRYSESSYKTLCSKATLRLGRLVSCLTAEHTNSLLLPPDQTYRAGSKPGSHV